MCVPHMTSEMVCFVDLVQHAWLPHVIALLGSVVAVASPTKPATSAGDVNFHKKSLAFIRQPNWIKS